LGAFSQWVKGTWRNRHGAVICEKIMETTAQLLTSRLWIPAKTATDIH
jgi:hypothetical protein